MSADSTTTSLRTFIGSVVCIDIVGYSKLSVDRQIEVKKRFNARLVKVLARVPAKDRVMLDTGDGVLIGFLADPEECFATVLKVRDAIEPGSVRIGIHLGSVKLIPGVSGDVRLVGDTASIAERITAFAEPGQIVVSRAFHSMVSRLSDSHEASFRNEGTRTDKSGQSHEIFVVDAPPPRKLPSSMVVIATAVPVVAALGVAAWFLAARKPAAQPELPVAAKTESPQPVAKAKPREPEPKKEAPMPTEVRTVPPPTPKQEAPAPKYEAPAPKYEAPPPEPRRAQAARSEPRPAPPPETRPQPAPSPRPAQEPGEAKKFFKGLWSGTKEVFSGGKEKTASNAPAASSAHAASNTPAAADTPAPRVLSRAATYFPAEASSQGMRRGKVHARLDIDASGNVTRVTILSADPPGYFESEATRSLRLWKFDTGAGGRTYTTDLEFTR